MSDLQKNEIESENILDLLEQAKNQPLGKFPVPPFTKWLNGSIIEIKTGYVEIIYQTRQEMANPTNILHGGAQSAMIDDSIGIACATLGYKNFLITIDLRLDYLGRIPVGKPVKIIARVVREGKRIIHAEAQTYLENGTLVGIAQSNLLRISKEPNYQKESLYEHN